MVFSAAVAAEYVTVQPLNPSYPLARLVLSVVTYLTAFAFYAVVYSFDVNLHDVLILFFKNGDT